MTQDAHHLDEIEAQIAAEEADDAARTDDEQRPGIRTYDGWSDTGAAPRSIHEEKQHG
ncbi:hypothetical protein [Gordonia sp. 852002-51296_SCH5728562-b]|uniref:hypothetical protein n=1 Tax=Gordonia sp. 852002-51296_SCH5728562-b TaxID=1834101 RepID=UPI000AE92B61|nr:hypothetical protein [Gordonia sp. 852002-51296_SCH5728562-b]